MRRVAAVVAFLALAAAGCGGMNSELLGAAKSGDAERVQDALQEGADRTGAAVEIAAYQGHPDIVKLLLEKGADVNTKVTCPSGSAFIVERCPLIAWASSLGRADIVKYLVEHGADVNARGAYRMTSLLFAAMAGDADVIQLLLQHGADANARNASGATPLILACRAGSMKVARLLLTHGADPNASSPVDGTPLLAAVKSGREDLVRMLLVHGAAVTTAALAAAEDRPFIRSLLEGAVTGNLAMAMSPGAAPEPPAAPRASDVDDPSFRDRVHPHAYAVVIGVEHYSESLPRALYADRDAQTMRRYLRALGYKDRNVRFLEDEQATYSQIKAMIATWLHNQTSTDPGATVFVYYSGHGAPDPDSGDAYLLPSDGDPQYLKDTAYSLKSLSRDLAALPAKNVLVALDCCFSGAGGRSVMAAGARSVAVRIDPGLWSSSNMGATTAAGPTQIAGPLESQGHGLFTYYLLKGLKENRGRISLKALYDYAKPRVEKTALRDDNRRQSPRLFGQDVHVTLSGGLR